MTVAVVFNDLPLTVWLAIVTVIGFGSWELLIRPWASGKDRLPLPPTPPGSWLTGNLSELLVAVGKKQQHLLFHKWSRDHGEIIRVRMGLAVEYYLNSDKAVKEILDKQSAFTSERPRWIASNEQICNKLNVLLLCGSDSRWKHQRKVTHNGLTSVHRADAGLKYLHYESAKFLYDVASSASSDRKSWALYAPLLRYTYSTFSSQIFGMDVPEDDNAVIQDIHETGLAQILGTLPGLSIVDALPFLDWLPLILKPWERRNRERFQRDLRWSLEKLARLRGLHTEGRSPDAFLSLVNADPDSYNFQGGFDEASYLSLMLVVGAADTSAMSTWGFLEAMLLFPNVQERARNEVLKVVGDRMPVYEDLHCIPYVRCLMKETWRWRPPVALGHPHVTTKDIVYNGYRIPKGASLHLNAYAISHDPARHEKPDEFIPERFLNDTTTSMQSINLSDVTSRDHFAFGAGRRVCPGYHVAERSLAVAIMRILWAFHVLPAAGTKLPLDPLDFEGQIMPGVADRRMPIDLKVLNEKKHQLINDFYLETKAARQPMEPLVNMSTGQGAFERLPFAIATH